MSHVGEPAFLGGWNNACILRGHKRQWGDGTKDAVWCVGAEVTTMRPYLETDLPRQRPRVSHVPPQQDVYRKLPILQVYSYFFFFSPKSYRSSRQTDLMQKKRWRGGLYYPRAFVTRPRVLRLWTWLDPGVSPPPGLPSFLLTLFSGATAPFPWQLPQKEEDFLSKLQPQPSRSRWL